MEIMLDQVAYSKIFEHANKTYPNECCGFLYGEETDKRLITQTLEINNAMQGNQRDKFEIGPKDYQYGERFGKQINLSLLGIYHSHPDHPAYPSDFDLHRAFPFFSYIIISLEREKMLDIKSWKLGKNRSFEEEAIQLTKKV